MSCSVRIPTIGDIIGSLRRPSLKALIWRAMYSWVWPARLGYWPELELPSVPWQ